MANGNVSVKVVRREETTFNEREPESKASIDVHLVAQCHNCAAITEIPMTVEQSKKLRGRLDSAISDATVG